MIETKKRRTAPVTIRAIMDNLNEIQVDITVELGSTMLPVHHLLRLGRGAVIELETLEDEPMRIYANKTLIALGEVKVDDGRLTVEVTERVGKPIRGARLKG